jgi:hypothetical protein
MAVTGGNDLDTMVDEVMAMGDNGNQAEVEEFPQEEVAEVQSEEVEQQEEVAEEESEEEQSPDQEQEEEIPTGTRAQKRIQALVAEKKKLQEELQGSQQVFMQQMQQQQFQIQQAYMKQMQEQAKQTEMLQRQLQLLTERKEEEDPNLTPIERYEKQMLKKAQELAKQQLNPEIEQLKQQIESDRRQREEFSKKQEMQAKLQMFTEQTKLASQQYIFKDFAKESVGALEEPMQDMLLSFVASTGLPPEQAAQQFSKFLDQYHRARLSGKVTTPKAQAVRKSQQVPSVSNNEKQSSKIDYRPTWMALKENGYSSYLEWRNAGGPKLREPGR